jgi:hypothetical protein
MLRSTTYSLRIVRLFEIGEQGRDLKDWAARHANAPHPGAPTDNEDNLFLVNSHKRAALLSSNNIIHAGHEVEKENLSLMQTLKI